MINFNGDILANESKFLNHNNRGLRYGDGLFETLKVVNAKILFWEDHYFRLMSSMRILRMDIPMEFTLEFLEKEIISLIKTNQLESTTARVRLNVFRDAAGYYLPENNDVSYVIEAVEIENPFYVIDESPYEVELFKDYYVEPGLLSTLKSNNRIINVVGSIYASENEYDNCLLVNNNKNVVEALNGNVFLVKGNVIKTPPITDGCLNGIMRKQLMNVLESVEECELKEESISPFELQKADELFITNVITGIRPITKYRKKQFEINVAKNIIGKLNVKVRLS
ncbi:aminotransferase class IV [Zhouia amylolytica]|uniref:branched-chain-amino-acid transaminase n=1 Tax=Zhouia amylolytica AD3 TaxID=1286632 RepID=W2UQ82_9FLAO|nr:aminotransferase class IV [Zhouia amylolytica]ETN96295.1 4-amino-4-deoxychorismate lyase [Zhouia amylolytica AD3]